MQTWSEWKYFLSPIRINYLAAPITNTQTIQSPTIIVLEEHTRGTEILMTKPLYFHLCGIMFFSPFRSKKIIVFLLLAKIKWDENKLQSRRKQTRSQSPTILRQLYFVHNEWRTRKKKTIDDLTKNRSFVRFAALLWMQGSPRGIAYCAHTNKIIFVMMNDATMWPKRIEKVVLVVIMSWHNVFVLIANSLPFSLEFFFFRSFISLSWRTNALALRLGTSYQFVIHAHACRTKGKECVCAAVASSQHAQWYMKVTTIRRRWWLREIMLHLLM